ncbi:MAG TPA: hypothetical protein VKJ47_14030 [Candidatus Binatia bacterium]|nr:hypothetical protein [Candidatus Binatia bacterium]
MLNALFNAFINNDRRIPFALSQLQAAGSLSPNTAAQVLAAHGWPQELGQAMGDQSPLRRSMPSGFDFGVDLPVQQLLRQLPRNPAIDALLALHPVASFDTKARTPWDFPPLDWGAGLSFGWRW